MAGEIGFPYGADRASRGDVFPSLLLRSKVLERWHCDRRRYGSEINSFSFDTFLSIPSTSSPEGVLLRKQTHGRAGLGIQGGSEDSVGRPRRFQLRHLPVGQGRTGKLRTACEPRVAEAFRVPGGSAGWIRMEKGKSISCRYFTKVMISFSSSFFKNMSFRFIRPRGFSEAEETIEVDFGSFASARSPMSTALARKVRMWEGYRGGKGYRICLKSVETKI